MKSYKQLPILAFAGLAIFLFLLFSFSSQKGKTEKFQYHSINELVLLSIQDLSTDTNTLFAASGNCVLCHGDPSQFPSSTANLDSLGNDISPVNYWRATIMANSAKDPFWRAKVKHEVIENPELSQVIETFCTTCHAPNGHFNAIHLGADFYTINDLENDPMGLDGVSCTSCHSIENADMGTTFSGNITYNTNHEVYGPYTNPITMPMINHIGFTPKYGSHISSSEACGKCHSLMTETINENGELTGNYFPEQSVYHEWLNSIYAEEEVTCVTCHMDNTNESIKVSPMPPWLDARSPFLKHDLVGGNVFMLELLKDNIEELDLSASSDQFDDVINKSMVMLQERALEIEVLPVDIENDSIMFKFLLQNKSGHKLPSGYPSRKIMIEFIAKSLDGDTLFHSGGLNADGRIRGEQDISFESHYDYITEEEQVQIYEYVMGNEAEEVTTILTRAYIGLKDNRIPPVGFSSGHQSYDTTMIIGLAEEDDNFNIVNETEGSGSDRIEYRIPFDNNSAGLIVNVKVHYIAVPRKWLDQLFENDEPEILSFSEMYEQVESSSVIMKEVEFLAGAASIDELNSEISIFPNPNNGNLNVNSEYDNIDRIIVMDLSGKIVFDRKGYQSLNAKLLLPESSGKYIVIIELVNGQKLTKSVVRL